MQDMQILKRNIYLNKIKINNDSLILKLGSIQIQLKT